MRWARKATLAAFLAGLAAVANAGHDYVSVDRALKRYTGKVTAIGTPDGEGRIYSFKAARLQADSGYPPDELRGWRLTMLAGKRFASVFEVRGNTESEIAITSLDGPLNGVSAGDVFVVELIAIKRPPKGESKD
jgi:hypothetical protein